MRENEEFRRLLTAAAWAFWGHFKLRAYLYAHPSVWLLLAGLFGALLVALQTSAPLWITTLAFAGLAAGLIRWALHSPPLAE